MGDAAFWERVAEMPPWETKFHNDPELRLGNAMKTTFQILVAALSWALAYLAFIADIAGARNVLAFLAFLMLVLGPIALYGAMLNDKPEMPTHRGIGWKLQGHLLQVCLIAGFAWHGYTFTALAQSAGWLMLHMSYRIVLEKAKSNAAKGAAA